MIAHYIIYYAAAATKERKKTPIDDAAAKPQWPTSLYWLTCFGRLLPVRGNYVIFPQA